MKRIVPLSLQKIKLTKGKVTWTSNPIVIPFTEIMYRMLINFCFYVQSFFRYFFGRNYRRFPGRLTSTIFAVATFTLLCINTHTAFTATVSTSSYSNSYSPLGTNLSAVVDWTTAWPFVDAMKISRPWISQQEGQSWGGGGPLNLDANGNILSLALGQYATTAMFTDAHAHYPAGEYALLYDGEGKVGFKFNSGTIMSETPGRAAVNIIPQSTGIFLEVLATNPANPIRNIRLIMPGFENTYKKQPFHPLFLQRLANFNTLRFMDWSHTNGSPVSQWSQRITPNYETQQSDRGVALEYQIQLANTLHANPWFNIPHQADDNYVQQFATRVRAKLDPTLKPYIEYSNEVWNLAFEQGKYAQNQGLALKLSADAYEAGMRYYSQRSVEIFNIWKSIYGGTTDRFVRVLAGQAAWLVPGEQALSWKAAYKSADAYAIAPYFSPGDLPDPLSLSVNQIVDKLMADVTGLKDNSLPSNVQLAQKYNLPLVAYEGGVSMQSYYYGDKEPQVTELFRQVMRNPRMKDVYLSYLNNWKQSGGQLFMHYNDIGSISKWGAWGALEYQDQDISTAPKYQGLTNFISSNQVTIPPTSLTTKPVPQRFSIFGTVVVSVIGGRLLLKRKLKKRR